MKTPPPHVDDGDVERMINFLFGQSVGHLPAEERADTAYQLALHWAKLHKRSTPYAEALATKVRSRALWITAPTGIILQSPE